MCIIVFLHLPVEVAQCQQQHAFFYAATGGLLIAFLIGGNGLGRVFLCHVDVTHGVIHLVEIILVVVIDSHALQTTDHAFGVAGGDDLCLCDTGIELQFVGWVTACHFPEGAFSLGAVAQLPLYLSQ